MLNSVPKLLKLIALLCIAAVVTALISQYVFGMQPCAWCVLQRLIYLSIAIVCGVGLLSERMAAARTAATGIALAFSAGGMAAAWYQYRVAANLFSCDQTFADRFMVSSGLDANVPWLFGILASCMDARVEIMGLEYALWSLMLFAVISLLCVAALIRSARLTLR